MKFVVLGDAHMWPVEWQRLPAAVNDSLIAVAQVLRYAVDNDLSVISSGDIFNFGQKGGVSAVLRFLQEWIPKLKSFSYIVGNHDLTGYTSGLENPPWLDVFEGMHNVHHIDMVPTRADELYEGMSVIGIDYCHGRTDFMEKLEVVRELKPDVLMLHQGIRELLGFAGAWEVEKSELADIARIVICGHVHVMEDMMSGTTRILSPGSTIPWQFDELHDKQFPIVDLTGVDTPELEWVKIEQRRSIWEHDATNDEQREAVLEQIKDYELDESLPEDIRKPILRLRYFANEEFLKDLIEAAEDKVILDLTVNRVQLTAHINTSAFEDKPTGVDDIGLATNKHTSPGRVRDAATEIQRTKDPEGVIEKHMQAIMDKE